MTFHTYENIQDQADTTGKTICAWIPLPEPPVMGKHRWIIDPRGKIRDYQQTAGRRWHKPHAICMVFRPVWKHTAFDFYYEQLCGLRDNLPEAQQSHAQSILRPDIALAVWQKKIERALAECRPVPRAVLKDYRLSFNTGNPCWPTNLTEE